jgi:hypothetical protein
MAVVSDRCKTLEKKMTDIIINIMAAIRSIKRARLKKAHQINIRGPNSNEGITQ